MNQHDKNNAVTPFILAIDEFEEYLKQKISGEVFVSIDAFEAYSAVLEEFKKTILPLRNSAMQQVTDQPPPQRVWVLGAEDPEMDAIQLLLTACGEKFVEAFCDGARVTPANAYRGDDLSQPASHVQELVFVECWVKGLSEVSHSHIDHHRPGDYGYGVAPRNAVRASSLGQTISRLAAGCHPFSTWAEVIDDVFVEDYTDGPGRILAYDEGVCVRTLDADTGKLVWRRIPNVLAATAAGDHCLAAAYAGQCRGVSVDELRMVRTVAKANFLKIGIGEMLGRLTEARRILSHAPIIKIGDYDVVDLRGKFVAELPEVACQRGCAYIAEAPPDKARPNDRKIVLGGCGEGTHPGKGPVEAFLAGAIPELVDLYGDPVRGFAGGYIKG